MLMDMIAYVLIAFVVLALVFAKMSIVIISQSETKIIERPARNATISFAWSMKGIIILTPG